MQEKGITNCADILSSMFPNHTEASQELNKRNS